MADLEPKRVLVTGATGFIGRHVMDPLLVRGFEVHGCSLRALRRDIRSTNVFFHTVDLLSPGAAAAVIRSVRPSHLLHLAWISNPGRALMALENLSWAASSLELYRAFVETGGRRAVLAGSCAEYDWTYEHLHEIETPCRPSTLYGTAKNVVRMAVEMAGRQSGVSTAWARIFFLYGPHEPKGRLVSEVVTALLSGHVAKTSLGLQERDFLYVVDAGDALAMLLDGAVTGPVNVASGTCVQVRQLVQAVARLAGRPDLIAVGARPTPAGEPTRLTADITRLSREVGFVPRYQLDEGLAATLNWWRIANRG